MNGNSLWRLLLSVVAIGASIFYVYDRPAKLGLDLKGGTQVVLDLKPRPGQELTPDTAKRTVEVLRNRVDALGVTEPTLAISGEDRIIVELPSVTNPDEAVATIGRTAQLTVHPVLAVGGPAPAAPAATTTTLPVSPSTTAAGLGSSSEKGIRGQANPAATTEAPDANTGDQNQPGPLTAVDELGNVYTLGPAALTGEGIADARANPPDQQHLSWYLTIDFRDQGANAWTKLTSELACKPPSDPTRQSAFVLDGQVISAAPPSEQVQCGVGITGTTTEVSGSFTREEVQQLALLIRGGALPVDVTIASQQVLGPQLGAEAIDASRNAVIIGGILTAIFIFLYYRLLGLVAAVALAAYALISYAVLVALELTLTLPGIAGFVLAVAMAMDSNILVYERVKEEFATGRTLRSSSQLGFKNALSAILDSNATTLLAALTLFFIAVGSVKGFGVTLLVGTLVSMFVTLVVLRTLVQLFFRLGFTQKHPNSAGMHVGRRFRERMTNRPPNLMGLSKYFLIGSTVAVLIALSGVAVRGINYGVEFDGGRLVEYSTPKKVDPNEARVELDRSGFTEAVVQQSGLEDISIRTENISNEQEAQLLEIMSRLGGGQAQILRDEIIGPSFGEELKRKALIGLAIGLAVQLCYVAFRFRWTFGIGAVVAMAHDALLVLGIWAWLQKPFDAVFLASLLTIIAFSVNDTVVIFDRIREQRRRRAGEPFARVVSDACAQTFPRTVNLSLSALFIIAALYFLGGQTLSDFALALFLGIVLGIFSSIMVAAPIATFLEKWKPAIPPRTSATRTTANRQRSSALRKDEVSELPDETDTTVLTRPMPNRPAPRPRSKPKKRRR